MPVSIISQNTPLWDKLFLGSITVEIEQYRNSRSLHCLDRRELQLHKPSQQFLVRSQEQAANSFSLTER